MLFKRPFQKHYILEFKCIETGKIKTISIYNANEIDIKKILNRIHSTYSDLWPDPVNKTYKIQWLLYYKDNKDKKKYIDSQTLLLDITLKQIEYSFKSYAIY